MAKLNQYVKYRSSYPGVMHHFTQFEYRTVQLAPGKYIQSMNIGLAWLTVIFLPFKKNIQRESNHNGRQCIKAAFEIFYEQTG
jgi:hypothetical protein